MSTDSLSTAEYSAAFLIDFLASLGVTRAELSFSGGGDSGGLVFRNGSAVGIISGFWYNPIECSTDQNVFGFLYPFATDFLDIGVLVH